MSHQTIVRRLTEYLENSPYPVELAYLFGSAARGQTTPLSDVDVAVYLDEPDRAKRVRAYLPLLLDLKQAIGDGEVDLVYVNDASPALAYRIIAGELLYCADESKRVEVEARALSMYMDEEDLHQTYDRYLRRRILAGRMGERSSDMIDKRVVNDRLAYIHQMLTRLKGRRSLSLEEFKANEDQCDAASYELQTCIEAMTDIGNHLIAAVGLRKPKDRGEIMTVLAEAGVIPKDLANRLTKAIGLRNVLVHGYLGLVLDTVYQTVQEDLGDIEEFCGNVVRYLAQVSEGDQE